MVRAFLGERAFGTHGSAVAFLMALGAGCGESPNNNATGTPGGSGSSTAGSGSGGSAPGTAGASTGAVANGGDAAGGAGTAGSGGGTAGKGGGGTLPDPKLGDIVKVLVITGAIVAVMRIILVLSHAAGG